jgi:small subunit ribosomal protein S16
MVRLRLRRVGAKNQPSYRIVAADKESPRDGRFLEALGFYNPRTEPETIQLKEDSIYKWLSNGAQPSDSVRRIFDRSGLFERYERYQGGESLDVLLQEAAEAEEQRTGSPMTRHPTPSSKDKQVVESEE